MSGAQQEVPDKEGPEFVVEVVDDTPEDDRDKHRAPEHTDNDDDLKDADDDGVTAYSRKIQARISRATAKAQAERRAKEAAARERDEATSFARRLTEENTRLRQIAENAERVALEQAKQRTQAQVAKVQRDVREALESGDPERIVEAQTALHRTVAEDDRLAQYRSPPQPTEKERREPPPQQRQVEIPKPDNRAEQWAANNPWFGPDEEMTGTAYGVHEKLVKSGVNPSSDEYYRRIDEVMRRRYPEAFKSEDREADERTPNAPRSASVVAPATRSVRTPRTVQLTASQVSLARRLGLTPEQYAAEVVKEARSAE
jgi:hypothetical protein